MEVSTCHGNLITGYRSTCSWWTVWNRPSCPAPLRDLAAAAGVNPNTMQRALAELEQEGLIYAQRTAGRFVTDDKELIVRMRNRIANEQIKRLFETLLELGYSQEELKQLVQDYFAE